MADDSDLRQDLLRRVEYRRAAVQAFLREQRPRARRRMTLTIVLTSSAALFTAGPAFGGETFAESVQGALGLADDSSVWRVLCFLALVVSVSAAVLTNIGKSQDDAGRLAGAEAANAELEGLAGLLQFGQLTVQDGAKLYQEYIAKIPFVDDAGAGQRGVPHAYTPTAQGPGYYYAPPQGGGYSPAPPQAPGPYFPPAPGQGYYTPPVPGSQDPPPGSGQAPPQAPPG